MISDHAEARLVKAAEQIYNRGLAAARRSDQSDCLACIHFQCEVGQYRVAVFIIKVHVIEFDLAQDRFCGNRVGSIVDFGRCVDQFEDFLCRRDGMLHLGIDARQILYRPHHERKIRDESVDAANRHRADDDLITAIPNDHT